MRLRAWWRGERGQSLVIVALMLVVLVGALGLAVDVGNLYAQRRSMQNAADAAALAGARELALDKSSSSVEAAIQQYAIALNGAHTVESDVLGKNVTVTVTKVVPSYFMGILNIPTNTVAATAQAGYCAVGNPEGVMPFGVYEGNIKFGVESMVWDNIDGDPTKDKDYPKDWVNAGNNLITSPHRGWINLDPHRPGNAADTKLWLKETGYPGVLDVRGGGIWREGTTGTKASCLGSLKEWVDKYPKEDERRKKLIPVYDNFTQEGSDADFHIVGFAMMHIIEVQKTTNFKYILGRFEEYVKPGPGERCGGEDFGARIVQLER